MTAADTTPAPAPLRREVPRLDDDYSPAAARQRMAFVAEVTGVAPEHVGRYSFDPAVLAGNIENFVGVAQVPIGLAGPLLVDGEHARGTFYVPLATTEGALVASYNRGMKLVHAAGGVRTTVVADVMQRAPAFGFDSAREARAFGDWVTASFAAIKAQADASTRAGHLHDIEQFPASRFMFLRFNYTTGDAAGQNLTGKATLAACTWIRSQYAGIRDFYLEANLATDKKSSQVNILRTRGKRVVAEATLPADLVRRCMPRPARCSGRARSATSAGCWRERTATGTTRPTPSRRCSRRPGRTSPTWPSRRRPWSTPRCWPTAATTTPSPSRH
jgi:hydroxymethylglutaryl-CoA reductase (NADPH)